jgi:hypothetical protein
MPCYSRLQHDPNLCPKNRVRYISVLTPDGTNQLDSKMHHTRRLKQEFRDSAEGGPQP